MTTEHELQDRRDTPRRGQDEAARIDLINAIVEAVTSKTKPPSLTDDEQRWVRMAIQREAQSIELRKAIIEKTLAGLVWFLILGFGAVMLEWAKTHGFKP